MRRIITPALAGALTLLVACGTGSRGGAATGPKQPSDPRAAATATLPAVLPTPIPAVAVTGGSLSSQATTTPSVYVIKSGDTLAAVAAKLNVPLNLLQSYNGDVDPSNLKIGQELKIPPAPVSPTATSTGVPRSAVPATSATAAGTRTPVPGASAIPASGTTVSTPSTSTSSGGGQTYTVQSSDTACKIATNFQIGLQDLAQANGISAGELANLKIGQQLRIPPSSGASRGC